MTDIKENMKPTEIIKNHYLYFVEVAEPTEIYFNNGFWFGWFINKYGGLKDVKLINIFTKKMGNNYTFILEYAGGGKHIE